MGDTVSMRNNVLEEKVRNENQRWKWARRRAKSESGKTEHRCVLNLSIILYYINVKSPEKRTNSVCTSPSKDTERTFAGRRLQFSLPTRDNKKKHIAKITKMCWTFRHPDLHKSPSMKNNWQRCYLFILINRWFAAPVVRSQDLQSLFRGGWRRC